MHRGRTESITTPLPSWSRRCFVEAIRSERVTTVDEWMGRLADAGELTPDLVTAIVDVHGERGLPAVDRVHDTVRWEYPN